jgi:tRNA threonylcarbamoyladenosine biosynthesis protein TsaB
VPEGFVLAGNAFGIYGDALPKDAPRVDAVPSATAMLRLAPALIAAGGAHDAAQALPVYIRDKVAQTTEERAQARRTT